jgi:putative NADPH-quinone reductase
VNVLSPVMIVLAHPRAGSLDHHLSERVLSVLGQTGVRHSFHDLYAESFDPVLTENEAIAGEVWTRGTSAEQVRVDAVAPDPLVGRHRRELAESKALVVIHPDWWGKPPAILTGWLDRVLLGRSGGEDGRFDPAPKLQRVLVINTSEQPASQHDAGAAEADPLGLLWREQIGPFLGSPKFERLTFRPSADPDPELRSTWVNASERAAAWVCGAAR